MSNEPDPEPTPVRPPTWPSGTPRPPGLPGGEAGAAGLWLLRLLLTAGLAIVAGVAGLQLAVFGLSGVALVAAVGVLAVGVLGWRRGLLPLATVASALALGGAAGALADVRIDRSAGLLTVKPRAAATAQGASWRRGMGDVFVDLRDFSAAPASTVRMAARSDSGRVIVALPRDRCFNLVVKARQLDWWTTAGGSIAQQTLSTAGLLPTDDGTSYDAIGAYRPFGAPAYEGTYGVSNLEAFGRTVLRPQNRNDIPFVWTRTTALASAPTLDLNVAAGGRIVIRDYPRDVGPVTDVSNVNVFAQYGGGASDQVSDGSWPASVQLPLSPGQRSWALRWRRDWNASAWTRRVHRAWQAWERQVIPAAQAQARRAAGACATRAQLADYWATAWEGRDNTTALSVNGLGRVRRITPQQANSPSPENDPTTQAALEALGATS